jgi:hypothetical protein
VSPLGVLCGTFDLFSKLTEPFVDFIRYMPAPAFGILCLAVLGLASHRQLNIPVDCGELWSCNYYADYRKTMMGAPFLGQSTRKVMTKRRLRQWLFRSLKEVSLGPGLTDVQSGLHNVYGS